MCEPQWFLESFFKCVTGILCKWPHGLLVTELAWCVRSWGVQAMGCFWCLCSGIISQLYHTGRYLFDEKEFKNSRGSVRVWQVRVKTLETMAKWCTSSIYSRASRWKHTTSIDLLDMTMMKFTQNIVQCLLEHALQDRKIPWSFHWWLDTGDICVTFF